MAIRVTRSSSSGVRTIKVALVGDSDVGKTCIFRRYLDNEYEGTPWKASLGIDFKTKDLSREGKKIKLQVWDTAGMEKFRSSTLSYVRDTQGVLLCYDITRPDSTQSVRRWIEEITKDSRDGNRLPMVLAGTKLDKAESENAREVMPEVVKALANEYNVPYIETSAKDGRRVNDAFDILLDTVLAHDEQGYSECQAEIVRLQSQPQPKKKSKCRC